MSTGQEFVKKIGPVGSVLFLLVFAAFLVMCFMPPKAADGFSPAYDTAYYTESAEHMEELKTELEKDLLPQLKIDATTQISGEKLVVTFSEADYKAGAEGVLKHYDESLFVFEKEDRQ